MCCFDAQEVTEVSIIVEREMFGQDINELLKQFRSCHVKIISSTNMDIPEIHMTKRAASDREILKSEAVRRLHNSSYHAQRACFRPYSSL